MGKSSTLGLVLVSQCLTLFWMLKAIQTFRLRLPCVLVAASIPSLTTGCNSLAESLHVRRRAGKKRILKYHYHWPEKFRQNKESYELSIRIRAMSGNAQAVV